MNTKILLSIAFILLNIKDAFAIDCPPFETLVTPELLSALDPECILNSTSTDISKIPSDSCSGFTPVQASNLGIRCFGLSPACISNFSVTSISGFSSSCLKSLTFEAVSALTANEVSHITPDSISGFTEDNIGGLGFSCSGLSRAQVSQFDDLACANLSASCAKSFTPEAVSGFTRGDILYLTPEFFGSLSSESVGYLDFESFLDITEEQLSGFGSNCAGLTGLQFSKLDLSCSGLRHECGKVIKTDALGKMSWTCALYTEKDFLSALNAKQFSSISREAFSGFNENFAAFTKSCKGMKSDQLDTLRSDACKYMQPSCISNIPAEIFYYFNSFCTMELKPWQLNQTTIDQIEKFSSAGFGGLTSEIWLSLIQRFPSLAEKLTPTDLISCSRKTTSNFGLAVDNRTIIPFRNLCPITASTLTWLKLCLSQDTDTSCVNATTAQLIAPWTWMGLRSLQASYLSPEVVANLSYGSGMYFSCGVISELSAAQIAEMSVDNFQSFNDVKCLNVSAASGVRADQVVWLPSYMTFTCEFAKALHSVVQQSLVCHALDDQEEFYSTSCGLEKCQHSSSDDPERPPNHLGFIIGCSLGGVALVAIFVGLFIWFKRSRSNYAPIA